ncbi:MAG TPA: DNA repair protein RecO [Bacteroidia bacterium]|jgi:DNA repair protein RecO (recombination protein O)|nr:DNA repair protein RecO [Bacteroidia bacterium]
MFHSVEAIVLQLIPHKDHNAIVKLFSCESGLVSCWINSLHSKSSGIRSSGLQPLTIITAVIDQRETKQLSTLKEMQIAFFPTNISNTIEKSAIAMFMAELLSHSIKEPAADDLLYGFLRKSIILLNDTKENCANFHIVFMLNLSNHLGILPKNSYTPETPYLNLEEGNYLAKTPLHTSFLYPDESECISKLSALPIELFHQANVPGALRKNILHGLIKYFEIHVSMSPLKSHLVLEEVF